MGFDSYRYRPRLVLGVIGLLDHPRKGKHLVERVCRLPFVEVVASEGKVPEEQLLELYQRVNYVLIPATVEGGPMCLLEGLAMGKPVIAPEGVGIVPEFVDTKHIRRYATGDGEALVQVVTACYQEKLQRSRLVQDRSWDQWAEAHHHLFMRLLRQRGMAVPKPAPGFRFGMMGELEVPLGIDVGPLEEAVDLAARYLFYGRYAKPRSAVGEVLPQYPFAGKLVETIPKAKKISRRVAEAQR